MALYINKIQAIFNNLKTHIHQTSLQYNSRLSIKHKCNVFLKREDQQITRSYKVRGCLNKILNNINNINNNQIICASAGNHAQGISYFSNKFNLNSTIFLPTNTPNQKIKMIYYYGKENINLIFIDGEFDNSLNAALDYSSKNSSGLFIHPYDDYDIIYGQATIAHEIYNKLTPDYIMCPVGGGGLISGISKYSKHMFEPCKIIGIEPSGAASLQLALSNNKPVKLMDMDIFVDGAAVAQIGDKTFNIIRDNVDENLIVKNSEIAKAIIDMYEYDGIILEPAGALSIAGLSKYTFNSNDIVVCVLSGSNNDLSRYGKYLELIRNID
jgi:threonine dehydratase